MEGMPKRKVVRPESAGRLPGSQQQSEIGPCRHGMRRMDEWDFELFHHLVQIAALVRYADGRSKTRPVEPFNNVQHRAARTRRDEVRDCEEDAQGSRARGALLVTSHFPRGPVALEDSCHGLFIVKQASDTAVKTCASFAACGKKRRSNFFRKANAGLSTRTYDAKAAQKARLTFTGKAQSNDLEKRLVRGSCQR